MTEAMSDPNFLKTPQETMVLSDPAITLNLLPTHAAAAFAIRCARRVITLTQPLRDRDQETVQRVVAAAEASLTSESVPKAELENLALAAEEVGTGHIDGDSLREAAHFATAAVAACARVEAVDASFAATQAAIACQCARKSYVLGNRYAAARVCGAHLDSILLFAVLASWQHLLSLCDVPKVFVLLAFLELVVGNTSARVSAALALLPLMLTVFGLGAHSDVFSTMNNARLGKAREEMTEAESHVALLLPGGEPWMYPRSVALKMAFDAAAARLGRYEMLLYASGAALLLATALLQLQVRSWSVAISAVLGLLFLGLQMKCTLSIVRGGKMHSGRWERLDPRVRKESEREHRLVAQVTLRGAAVLRRMGLAFIMRRFPYLAANALICGLAAALLPFKFAVITSVSSALLTSVVLFFMYSSNDLILTPAALVLSRNSTPNSHEFHTAVLDGMAKILREHVIGVSVDTDPQLAAQVAGSFAQQRFDAAVAHDLKHLQAQYSSDTAVAGDSIDPSEDGPLGRRWPDLASG